MAITRLSDLKFKNLYDTHKDNVAIAFYEKALTLAKYYDRVSAFFDSKILAYYSRWIENLYNNNWKIRFIFSEELTEYDFNQMKDGYDARALNKLEENFDREALDEIDKTNLSNLAFLIEQWLVDIKIAFVKPGILHDKMWLIYDDNNYIYFRWSNNETVAALEANHESFEVSCSWDNQEKENEKIKAARKRFEELRNNEYDEWIRVVDIPDIIKNKVAKYNRWKLVLKPEFNFDNAIVADITDDWEFVIYNKLEGDVDISWEYDFENFIKFSLVEQIDNKFLFWKINYIKIQTLIKHFVDLAWDLNKQFLETLKLRQFLEDKTYAIEKIKELGKLIKKQDSFVIEDFNEFSEIVNDELERRLRDKQMWDSFFICQMIKSANYSVPWSGKTSIVYWAYAYLTSKKKKKIDTMVVVWPISSFKSWEDEYKACFWNKRKKPRILNILECKNKKEKIYNLRNNKYDLILVNYEWLNSIKEVLAGVINNRTLLVFDEVHKIKRVDWVWASAALSICWNTKYKVILTWTPIPNSYADLYNQLNILYTDEYNTFFNMTPAALGQKNLSVQEEINKKIYPFFCRTTKKQLLVPAPNQDEKIISYMDSNEERLFSLIHKRFYRNPLLLYIRLLQASNNPKLVLNNIDESMLRDLYEAEDENEDNMKFDEQLKELNEDMLSKDDRQLIESFNMTSKFWTGIEQVKKLVSEWKTVLVRWIFVNTIDRISEELSKAWISNKVIYWAVTPSMRGEIIEEFKNKKFKVLITNPHTMAESVSLHMICHDAVYFEYSFNLTHMLQSRDRINRLWLPDNQYTQYYYLFLVNKTWEDDSIDLKTYDRLKEKEDIMLKAIEWEQIISIDFDVLDDLKIIMRKN